MESLRSAVVTVCMMSAAVGMLSMICPGGALARQMRFLISLLFAVSLAVPLLHFEVPPAWEELSDSLLTDQLSGQAQETVLQETQKRLQAVLADTLAEHGITCDSVEAALHIGDDGCIHISKVTVCCDDFAGANALLSDLLGEEAEISVTQVLTEDGSP